MWEPINLKIIYFNKNITGLAPDPRSTPSALQRAIYRKELSWKPWDMHELPKCDWNWKLPLHTFSFRQVSVQWSCWEVISSTVSTQWWLYGMHISLHRSNPHWSQDEGSGYLTAPLLIAILLCTLLMPTEQELLKTECYKPALAGTQVLALQIHILFKTNLN